MTLCDLKTCRHGELTAGELKVIDLTACKLAVGDVTDCFLVN
jgi:hypothetical protein